VPIGQLGVIHRLAGRLLACGESAVGFEIPSDKMDPMSSNTVVGVNEGRADAEGRPVAEGPVNAVTATADEPRPETRESAGASANPGESSSATVELIGEAADPAKSTVKAVAWASTLTGVPAPAFSGGAVHLTHEESAQDNSEASSERPRPAAFLEEEPDAEDLEYFGAIASRRPFVRSLGLGVGGAFVLGLAVVGLIRIGPQDSGGPLPATGVGSSTVPGAPTGNPPSGSVGTVVPTTRSAPFPARDQDQSVAGAASPATMPSLPPTDSPTNGATNGATTIDGAPTAAGGAAIDEDAPPVEIPSRTSPRRAFGPAAREPAPASPKVAPEAGNGRRVTAAAEPGAGADRGTGSSGESATRLPRKTSELPGGARAGDLQSSARRESSPSLSPPPLAAPPRSPSPTLANPSPRPPAPALEDPDAPLPLTEE